MPDDLPDDLPEQLLLTCILFLSSDVSLFNGLMALRKMNLLTVNKLAQKDRKAARRILIEVQNVLAVTGVNFAMDGAARIMHFAYHVKYVWGGKISENPRELLKLHGVGRKVLMLTLQDAWAVHEFKGIVCDSHVTRAIFNLGLTTVKPPENGEVKTVADKVAEELEQWVPQEWYRDVNECLASPRQLWRDRYNYKWMRTGAKKVGAYEILRLLCQGVTPQKKSSRTEAVTSVVMESRQASFFQNPHFGKLPPEPKKDEGTPKLENSI